MESKNSLRTPIVSPPNSSCIYHREPNFIGDSIPMNIKRSRGEGDELLRRRLTAGEFSAYESIEELLIDVAKGLAESGNSKAGPISID